MVFPDGVLLVKSGDIAVGMWGLTDDLIAMNNEVIMTSEFLACTVVSDRHETSHTGAGRIAGGILGAVLLGPIGAAGGLMTGGKTRVDETIIYCTLTGGRSFSAEVSQLTAARMQHICQRNSANTIQQQTQSVATENALRTNSVSSIDTIECPMCAELIKAKAKICRYCGHNLLEEKEKILAEIRADPSVEEIYSLKESINKYRAAVDYDTSSISNENIAEILNCFSRLGDLYPEEGYRALADRVKAELDIPSKTYINDMVREGFRFIRNSVPFQVRGDVIAVRRSVTSRSEQ